MKYTEDTNLSSGKDEYITMKNVSDITFDAGNDETIIAYDTENNIPISVSMLKEFAFVAGGVKIDFVKK
ncbi:MAG: hypothetical protein ACTSYW_01480 [Candidatus Heimdallarchaeota archaeon]